MSNARTLANIINSSSEIVVPSGGIAFTDLDSSNDAVTANEDYVMGQNGYEEGTFTPTVTGSSTAGTGTYSVQVGRYTKIGNVVTVQVSVYTTAHTGSGNIRLTNLPFTAYNLLYYYSVASIFLDATTLTAGNYAQGVIIPGTNYIELYQYPTGGGNASAVPIDTNSQVIYTVTYEVN